MARGDATTLDRARVAAAVATAEATTGLEICVAICQATNEPPREQAERAFSRLHLASRPGVLILLLPDTRALEIVTSAAAAQRISDVDCERAASAMTAQLSTGDLAAGVEAGLAVLTSAAGAGHGANPGDPDELPDLLDT